jgi:arsenite oxidase small subunit
MERRDFVSFCAGAGALAATPQALLAKVQAEPRFYSRARLTDEMGRPVKVSELVVNKNYLFHYPYAGTPCFLLNLEHTARQDVELKTADGTLYSWSGGVGPKRSIVAFSAICSHKLSFPTRQHSFISFRHDTVATAKRGDVIACCHEGSIYDPAEGGRVLNGPAPQPLAAILLEYDQKADGLTAVGTLGGETFNAFFEKYEVRLVLEYGGTGRAQRKITDTTRVTELDRFCKNQIRC